MKKSTLVLGYTNPDLDSFACAIAYSEFLNATGQKAFPAIFGTPIREVTFVLDYFNIPYPTVITHLAGYKEIILVDASNPSDFTEQLNPLDVTEIIDHHVYVPTEKTAVFKNALLHIEFVGAAATLVVEKFRDKKVDISSVSAALLYAAIISNTLHFQAKVTTERDKIAAEWLRNKLTIPSDFLQKLFLAKSDVSGNRLQESLEGDFSWFLLGNKKVGIAQLEIVGAQILAAQREYEIIHLLEKMKRTLQLDYVFLSIVELLDNYTIFITSDVPTQGLLQSVFGRKLIFRKNTAIREGLIMRKEIVPLLRQELEKESK